MGRPFLQSVEDGRPRYTCKTCRCVIASKGSLVWEGYMGTNLPAVLFRNVVNCDTQGEQRMQMLSSGAFLLQDVCCRSCLYPMGWRYVKALSQEQKYKEGTTILQKGLLQCVDPETDADAVCRSHDGA